MNREMEENEIRNPEDEVSVGTALLNEVNNARQIKVERACDEPDYKLVDVLVKRDIRRAIEEGRDKSQDLRDIEWGSFKKHMGDRPYGSQEIFGTWDQKYKEKHEELFGKGYSVDRYDSYYKENDRRTQQDPFQRFLPEILIPELLPQEPLDIIPINKIWFY